VQPNPAWSRVGDAHDPDLSGSIFVATDGVESPFGSHISLAVTEKDTEVLFSSAKKYA